MMMNAVRNDLGVGFRRKAVSQAFKCSAQRLVVFDDAVVDDGDIAARNMGMGIFSGGYAVGRPARMRNADRARDRLRVERILKDLDLADGTQSRQFPVIEDGQSGGVVTAVLQAAQSLHQNGNRAALGNHAPDSAHSRYRSCNKRVPSVPETQRNSRPSRPGLA